MCERKRNQQNSLRQKWKHRRKRRKRRKQQQISRNNLNIRIILCSNNKWSTNTKNITFGGKEASIGIALNDTFVLTNSGNARVFTIRVDKEADQAENKRYKIIIRPDKFQLEKVQYQQKGICFVLFIIPII